MQCDDDYGPHSTRQESLWASTALTCTHHQSIHVVKPPAAADSLHSPLEEGKKGKISVH